MIGARAGLVCLVLSTVFVAPQGLAVAADPSAATAAPVAPPDGWEPGRRARCFVVEVRTPNGRPVPGATVTYFESDPSEHHGNGQEWTADARGRICARPLLQPGHLWIAAPEKAGGWCAGFEEQRHRGWSPASEKPRALTVTLHLRHLRWARISGRVLDARGRPVGGAEVRAQHLYPARAQCSTSGEAVTTTADGHFRSAPVPYGRGTLLVRAAEFAPQTFDVAIPAPARDLVVDPGGEWIGRVLGPDGQPLEGCHLQIRTSDDLEVSARCTSDGFALHHLPAGDVTLNLTNDEAHRTLGVGRRWLATTHLERNEQRRLDIVWAPGATITGAAVTEAGGPVPFAEILAVSKDRDRASAGDSATVTAGKDGRFVIHHLVAGDWELLGDRRSGWEQGSIVAPAGASEVRLVIPERKR